MTPSIFHAKSRRDLPSTISNEIRCFGLFSIKVTFIPLAMAVSGLHIRWLKSDKVEMYLEGKF